MYRACGNNKYSSLSSLSVIVEEKCPTFYSRIASVSHNARGSSFYLLFRSSFQTIFVFLCVSEMKRKKENEMEKGQFYRIFDPWQRKFRFFVEDKIELGPSRSRSFGKSIFRSSNRRWWVQIPGLLGQSANSTAPRLAYIVTRGGTSLGSGSKARA